MSALDRILDLLPLPYSAAHDSVLARLLNVVALECDAAAEDLERVRQSHWIKTATRLVDVEKIAALAGIARASWETRDLFRERVLALVEARIHGAIGPREIREFVYDFLLTAQQQTDCTFMPGLAAVTLAEAYSTPAGRPRFRPLRLLENPVKTRWSDTLRARGGRVTHLFRWEEQNRGLNESFATLAITGWRGGATAVPVLVNRTSGDLLGYAARVPFGETLEISPAPDATPEAPRVASADLNGADVTGTLFSISGFQMGVPFTREQFDVRPLLPRMVRGSNEWIFLSIGLYQVRGLDRFHFAMPNDEMRQGSFNDTKFDRALFREDPQAQLHMEWEESEPASFVVEAPRHIVMEPPESAVEGRPVYEHVAEVLRASVGQLHAAGVRAAVELLPFQETQRQKIMFRLPVKVLEPETGPAGSADSVTFGGRFGESALGGSRFE